MISVDLAPNENWDDALLSLSLLIQPSKWWGGSALNDVRKKLATMTSHKEQDVFLCLSGRACLYHIIKALGLEMGSEVLVTGFTCEAVVLPIIANNCTPKYIDIDDLDYSINPQKIYPSISKMTKVLLIQHTFGIPPRRDELLLLAKKHNIIVIEDLAHGFQNNIFKDDKVQTIKVLSFGRSKSFSSVFGGAVVVGDTTLREKMKASFENLRRPSAGKIIKLLNYKPLVYLVKSTYSFLNSGKILHRLFLWLDLLIPEISNKEKRGRYDDYLDLELPNALTILLSNQLSKYDMKYRKRQQVVKKYRQALKSKLKDDYSLTRFPVLVKDRNACLQECRKYGLYLGTWYTQPVAPAALDLKKVMYERGDCPVAEKVCKHIINLPTFVSEEQAEDIAEIIKPYLLEELPA
jgi:dTDP-4-amino-4,6-dideoxygalactose transaminase